MIAVSTTLALITNSTSLCINRRWMLTSGVEIICPVGTRHYTTSTNSASSLIIDPRLDIYYRHDISSTGASPPLLSLILQTANSTFKLLANFSINTE